MKIENMYVSASECPSAMRMMEKTLQFFLQASSGCGKEKFKATTGSLTKFLSRHGLRFISLQVKLYLQMFQVLVSFAKILEFIEHEGYTLHQVFNADKMGIR